MIPLILHNTSNNSLVMIGSGSNSWIWIVIIVILVIVAVIVSIVVLNNNNSNDTNQEQTSSETDELVAQTPIYTEDDIDQTSSETDELVAQTPIYTEEEVYEEEYTTGIAYDELIVVTQTFSEENDTEISTMDTQSVFSQLSGSTNALIAFRLLSNTPSKSDTLTSYAYLKTKYGNIRGILVDDDDPDPFAVYFPNFTTIYAYVDLDYSDYTDVSLEVNTFISNNTLFRKCFGIIMDTNSNYYQVIITDEAIFKTTYGVSDKTSFKFDPAPYYTSGVFGNEIDDTTGSYLAFDDQAIIDGLSNDLVTTLENQPYVYVTWLPASIYVNVKVDDDGNIDDEQKSLLTFCEDDCYIETNKILSNFATGVTTYWQYKFQNDNNVCPCCSTDIPCLYFGSINIDESSWNNNPSAGLNPDNSLIIADGYKSIQATNISNYKQMTDDYVSNYSFHWVNTGQSASADGWTSKPSIVINDY
jgi:hypothetical protein